MSPAYAIILDVVLVGLLIATIVYAIILNKQIVRLRDSRAELAELIAGLNEAMAKADSGVKGMRKTAGDTGEGLQKAIDKAASLKDELNFIIETGEALADRLGLAASATEKPRAAAVAASAPALRPPPRSSLIDDTLAAARSEASRQSAPGLFADEPEAPSSAPARDAQDGMSRAERELMQAIENRR
jgi:chromosome segregation ATPase